MSYPNSLLGLQNFCWLILSAKILLVNGRVANVLVGMSYLFHPNSLLGLQNFCWLILSAKILLVSDAEAQTAGMVRRQERRAGRRERRETRREARRAGRETRRAVRRGTVPQ
jgi:hypothetical protein